MCKRANKGMLSLRLEMIAPRHWLLVGTVLLMSCGNGESTPQTKAFDHSQEVASTPAIRPSGSSAQPLAVKTNGNKSEIVIKTNTQATTGDLKIGAGNFRVVEGEQIAKLWFFVRGKPEQNRSQKVRKGETIEIAGRRFEISALTSEIVTLKETLKPTPRSPAPAKR